MATQSSICSSCYASGLAFPHQLVLPYGGLPRAVPGSAD